jgi:hypothetical protein
LGRHACRYENSGEFRTPSSAKNRMCKGEER